jgi:hypothetical protein
MFARPKLFIYADNYYLQSARILYNLSCSNVQLQSLCDKAIAGDRGVSGGGNSPKRTGLRTKFPVTQGRYREFKLGSCEIPNIGNHRPAGRQISQLLRELGLQEITGLLGMRFFNRIGPDFSRN